MGNGELGLRWIHEPRLLRQPSQALMPAYVRNYNPAQTGGSGDAPDRGWGAVTAGARRTNVEAVMKAPGRNKVWSWDMEGSIAALLHQRPAWPPGGTRAPISASKEYGHVSSRTPSPMDCPQSSTKHSRDHGPVRSAEKDSLGGWMNGAAWAGALYPASNPDFLVQQEFVCANGDSRRASISTSLRATQSACGWGNIAADDQRASGHDNDRPMNEWY